MIVLPDILPNLLLWAAIGFCVALPSAPRTMRAVGVALALAAMPAVPLLMSRPFVGIGTTEPAPPGKGFVATFGGGASRVPGIGPWPDIHTAVRVAAGLEASRKLGLPLAFSGGVSEPGGTSEAAAVALHIDLPAETFIDATASNTGENAEAFAFIAASEGWTHAVIATGPTHRRRAAATLRAAGLRISGAAETAKEIAPIAILHFVPSVQGLRLWRRPSYEAAAIAFYLSTGRIDWEDLW